MEGKNLLKIFLAKGSGETLYIHILRGVKVIERIKDYIMSLPALDILKIDKKKFLESLIKAYILHDLGKISRDFQEKILEKMEQKEDYKNIKRTMEDMGMEKTNIERHEFLSIFWYPLIIGNILESRDDIEWKRNILLSVMIHHENEFFESRIYGEETKEEYLNNLPNSKRDFLEIWNSRHTNDYINYLNFLIRNFDIIYNSLQNSLEEIAKEIKDIEISLIIFKIIENMKDKQNIMNEIKKFRSILKNEEDEIEIPESLLSFYDDDLIKSLYEEKDGKLRINRSSAKFLLFSGILKEIDYLASNQEIFEELLSEKILLSLNRERKNKYYFKILEKIKEKSKNGHVWQEKILKEKGIPEGILKAPTGSGKTEFSILAFLKSEKQRLLYTIPLRAALNDLFENRFSEYFDKNTFGLLHSSALSSSLIRSRNILDAFREIQGARLLLQPMILATPDQILTSSLKFSGFDRYLPFYSHGYLVVDELQLYTPEMLAVTISSLKIAKDLGSKILVMTATMPNYMEKLLEEIIYNNGESSQIIKKDEGEKYGVLNWNKKRHMFEIREGYIVDEDQEKINEEIIDDIKKQKRINIVVNTVRKAIILYEKLKESKENGRLGDYEIILFHSRMLERIKDEKLKKIRELDKAGKKRVVISTQVIEASVDIDSDLLITSFAPIDALIQRFGRVFRQRELEENKPNIIIYCEDINNENGTHLDRHDEMIYASGKKEIKDIKKKILKESFKILKKYEKKKLTFREELEMVEKVYSSKELEKYKETIINFAKNLLTGKIGGFDKSEKQRIFRESVTIPILIPELVKFDELNYLSEENDIKIGKIIRENIEEFLTEESVKNIVYKLRKKFPKNIEINDRTVEKVKLIRKILLLKNIIPVRLEVFKELYERYLKGGKIWRGIYITNFPTTERNLLKKIEELGIDKYIFEKHQSRIKII